MKKNVVIVPMSSLNRRLEIQKRKVSALPAVRVNGGSVQSATQGKDCFPLV